MKNKHGKIIARVNSEHEMKKKTCFSLRAGENIYEIAIDQDFLRFFHSNLKARSAP